MKLKVNGKTYDLGDDYNGLMSTYDFQRGANRELVKIDFNGMTESEAEKVGLVDGVSWSVILKNEDNEEVEFDKSDYCLVCNKVITYDGLVSIYMGKYTDTELLNQTINDLLEV